MRKVVCSLSKQAPSEHAAPATNSMGHFCLKAKGMGHFGRSARITWLSATGHVLFGMRNQSRAHFGRTWAQAATIHQNRLCILNLPMSKPRPLKYFKTCHIWLSLGLCCHNAAQERMGPISPFMPHVGQGCGNISKWILGRTEFIIKAKLAAQCTLTGPPVSQSCFGTKVC